MENKMIVYRKEIDALDFKILDCLAQSGKEIETLLEKRKNLVKRMAIYKKKIGIPALDQKREENIVRTWKVYGKSIGLSEKEVELFFKKVFQDSHKVIEAVFKDKKVKVNIKGKVK